jgi:hypothetical protein
MKTKIKPTRSKFRGIAGRGRGKRKTIIYKLNICNILFKLKKRYQVVFAR